MCTGREDDQSIINDFCQNGEGSMSMGGESEDIPRVFVNGMPRGNEFRVRDATLRVARLGHAIRDYLLHMLFRFHFPFLPTLCARDGFVDTPPASREEAKMRRSRGQIWSIRAT